jgi:hypothetical protein
MRNRNYAKKGKTLRWRRRGRCQLKESREEYVKRRKKQYKEHTERHNQIINIEMWRDLVAQWKFDYDMDKIYQDK